MVEVLIQAPSLVGLCKLVCPACIESRMCLTSCGPLGPLASYSVSGLHVSSAADWQFSFSNHMFGSSMGELVLQDCHRAAGPSCGKFAGIVEQLGGMRQWHSIS